MRIRDYAADLELPATMKRRIWKVGIALVLTIGVVALAHAEVEKTWSSGELLRAEDLNDNFTALDERISALEAARETKSAFQASQTVVQTLAESDQAKVIFDSELYDAGGEYDPVTGIFRPDSAGYYFVSCAPVFEQTHTDASGFLRATVHVAGTAVLRNGFFGSAMTADRIAAGVLHLASGDEVTCRAEQQLGVNALVRPGGTFSAIRIAE